MIFMQDGSKVIVMDASVGRSKAIARSLKKLGVKVKKFHFDTQ